MNRIERILFAGSNIWIFADGMLGPLFSVFSQQIGGNVLDISWAWATYLATTGIFVILVGLWSDHVSKEKLLIAGYALTAIFTFCYLLVTTPTQLFLVQAGLGMALGLCNPTWFALYDAHMSPNKKGLMWGLEDGTGKLLTALAIILGGLIVQWTSFKFLFMTMGVLQVCATLCQIGLLKKKRAGK